MAWNIADLIEHVADTVPDRVALIVGDRAETFRELEENANRLAHHLAAHGVGPGDHVGIYAFNSHEFVETILAAYKLRAVPINVNYRYVEAELRYLFDNADLVALVHDEQFRSRIDAVRDSLPLLRHTIAIGTAEYADALASGSPERDFGPRSDDDIYILYTGGTTGMPKGVVWRQEDVLCVLGGLVSFDTGERVQDEWQFAKAAVDEPEGNLGIVIAPLMHGAAQWGTLNGLLNGRPNVLMPKFDPDEVWKAVEKHRITTLGITGDAMGRPLIESLVIGDGRVDGCSVQRDRERAVSGTVPELDHRGRGRLDRDRLQRRTRHRQGWRRKARPADRAHGPRHGGARRRHEHRATRVGCHRAYGARRQCSVALSQGSREVGGDVRDG
jgi:acyl-CoA synthetase (AMP-forming)/AMP-acid ligase II